MFRIRLTLCLALSLSAIVPPVFADDGAEDAKSERPIETWLLLDGAPSLPTAFVSEKNSIPRLDSEGQGPRAIRPRAGQTVSRGGATPATWRPVIAREGTLDLDGDRARRHLAHLVTYLTVPSFLDAEVSIQSDHLFSAHLNGEEILSHDGTEDEPATAKIPLETGTHRLGLTVARDPKQQEWTLRVMISSPSASTLEAMTISTDPKRTLSLEDILETRRVTASAISSDGALAALTFQAPPIPSPSSRRWIEIIDTSNGKIVRTLRSQEIRSFAWSPSDDRYAYLLRENEVSSLVVGSWKDGKERVLVDRHENLGDFRWSPDGRSLFFLVNSEDEPETPFAKRLRALPDRWADWRTKHSLFQVGAEDGSWRRLSAEAQALSIESISSDGSKILLARNMTDDDQWPYSRAVLVEIDLDSLESRTLGEIPWSATARYSPDGSKVLILGSPLAFGRLGVRDDSGDKPNLYDTQAYVLDSSTKKADIISLNFDPNIVDARWDRSGRSIFFLAEEASYVRLFRYRFGTREFERIPTEVDVIESFDLADRATQLVYRGSSVDETQQVHVLDTENPASATALFRRGEGSMADITPAKVVDWDFVSDAGITIPGRFYLPPRFDPQTKWPMIVYYYSGTSPSRRIFAGRYPQQYWAAQGYVVYVLQPSGATGFGQKASARHVNNWGRTVAGEIITGTKKFLEAHPFVDEKRVGAIGASYGGFMTMLLTTKTDIFAAAVSHAGISSLASYWGEGWWGYLYSAAASTGSYPWNAPELYIEQSPLFHADKITTPLLLLHGNADTNVPPGQSDLIYTALRVLGREVEYVQIDGEDHWILDHEKRAFWARTIVAWFDRKLKNEPAFWEHLYPEK